MTLLVNAKKAVRHSCFPLFFFICLMPAIFAGCSTTKVVSEQKISISQENIGYVLYDPSTQQIVSGHRIRQLFIPASVNKVPATLAALEILGPDHRFETLLKYVGQIENATLTGDLYFKGTGDPFLTASHLIEFADAMVALGIRKVDGHFYFDQSELPSQVSIDETSDEEASYNPGFGALSLEFNQYPIVWQETPKGTQVFSVPELPTLQISAQTRGRSPMLEFQKKQTASDGSSSEMIEEWKISPPAKPARGSVKVPVKFPGMFAAEFFRKICKMKGISLPLAQEKKTPKNAKTLHIHKSLPVLQLAEGTLEYSTNLTAELLFLAAAKKLRGKAVNTQEASQLIQDWWIKKAPYPSWEGFKLASGAGLAAGGRLTPEQAVSFFDYAEKRTYQDRSFLSLLPIAGLKGTLTKRLRSPNTALRVWAKTGTVSYANGLAGYLFTKSGKKLIFAIFCIDFAKRAEYEKNPDKLSDEVIKNSETWTEAATSIQDRLLEEWIQAF